MTHLDIDTKEIGKRLAADTHRGSRLIPILLVISGLSLLLVFGAFGYAYKIERDGRVSDSSLATYANDRADANEQAVRELNEQLDREGITPVVTPDDLPEASDTPPSATSNTTIIRREDVPFQAVLRAVNPQVEPALISACGGSCNGTDGEDSTVAGPAGADSTTPGPQGADGAKGDKGEKGEKGDQGGPGRGVLSLGCTGGLTPITFNVQYTDGTTESFTCGTLEPVEPTPEPSPVE